MLGWGTNITEYDFNTAVQIQSNSNTDGSVDFKVYIKGVDGTSGSVMLTLNTVDPMGVS